MGADNMMVVVERAMAAGHSVLIENMGESIDAVLNPVITRCVLVGRGAACLHTLPAEPRIGPIWPSAVVSSPTEPHK